MCMVRQYNWKAARLTLEKMRGKTKGMIIFWLVLFIAGSVPGCRSRNPEASQAGRSESEKTITDRIAEADAFYSQREDLSKVRLGIAVLRQARIVDDGNYEAAWKLAKFDYYLGLHSTDDRERQAAFREGIDAGKIAVQLQGDKADGHFWLGANYGGTAEISVLAALTVFQDIRREMERVIEIDPTYEVGSGYMVLGQLYLEAPRILGGDKEKAIEYFERGLRVGSDNGLLHLRLAEAYHATGRDRDARKQIDFILKMTPGSNYLPEHEETVAGAKELAKKIS
jgi:tetratricopeptide (TPR) repeat protein